MAPESGNIEVQKTLQKEIVRGNLGMMEKKEQVVVQSEESKVKDIRKGHTVKRVVSN